jgi:hypothetical protein
MRGCTPSTRLPLFSNVRTTTYIFFGFLMALGCNLVCSYTWLITLAARAEARTIFSRLNVEVVSSNPTRVIDLYVRLFCLCCPVYR